VRSSSSPDRATATGGSPPDADPAEREFEGILRGRRLESLFQPIVHMGTGTTAGYEALVRSPLDSTFVGAPALLRTAYRTGRVVEFDWVARVSACRAAMRAGLGENQLLFLNIEPLALGSDCPPDLWADIDAAFDAFQVVLEVTERSLDRDPRSLFEGIDHQRPAAAGLALDDLGAQSSALSMLPVLAPDVIKLDLTVTQAGPTAEAAKILDIAYEEAERTGAIILAEGVETATDAAFARSVGATLAQGHYFGEPAALPPARAGSDLLLRVGSAPAEDLRTPFDALQGWSIGQADPPLLIELSHQVAYREVPPSEPALVLVLVPDPDLLPVADRGTLADMARRGVVTGAMGPGLPTPPAEGVRGAPVHDAQLDGEWAVVTLSPGTASALLARQLPGSGARYEFGVTHDRRRVVSAMRCLLRHLGPLPVPGVPE
jgi:EAL domain-containing protein (putative c-di-GMP-specific phosphodiesterase class I)